MDTMIQGRLYLHLDNNQADAEDKGYVKHHFFSQNTAEDYVFSESFLHHDLGVLQLSCLGA
jgi:hypothetical protein